MSNLYYPQIRGVCAQFPIVRRETRSAYVNELASGLTFRMADGSPEQNLWLLQYSELTTAEWEQIATFFAATSGSLGTFTFLDAADNLLRWSEDLTQNVWAPGPLLAVALGTSDPNGGNSAVRITNASQATTTLTQAIGGPSWYQYCFSIYLRADAPSNVNLIASDGSETARKTVAVSTTWSRAMLSCTLSSQQDGIQFGLEVPAGVSIYAFGAQVEGQPGAGTYKKTTANSGVYVKCRFDQDQVSQNTDAVERHSTSVRIVTLS